MLVLSVVVMFGASCAATSPTWQVVSAPKDDECVLYDVTRVPHSQTLWAVDTCDHGEVRTARWLPDHGWRDVLAAAPARKFGNGLYAVAAVADDDVWAVGSTGTAEHRTLVEHWDGRTWTVVASPNPGTLVKGATNTLHSVVALSADNVWAVGYRSDPAHVAWIRTLVEHWDGSSWTTVASPNLSGGQEDHLNGICAVPNHPGLLWAVGDVRSNSGVDALILGHRHGHWRIAGPLPRHAPGHFSGLFACASNGEPGGLWAVGDDVVDDPNSSSTLVLQLTPTGWHHVPSPGPGLDAGLFDVAWVPGTRHWWAVGDWVKGYGMSRALILRYTGNEWRVVPSPGRTPEGDILRDASLRSVVVISPDNAWAVGAQSPAPLPLVEHYR